MPIISSTIFPWAELHNDFQQPIQEGGISYPSITHYICAMTQLTGVAIRYIINEPNTPNAIEVAHAYYTGELLQTELNSIFKFYNHAIQQNQLFADTLESIIHTHIAYQCSSSDYPYLNSAKNMEYDYEDGPGNNTIGTLLMRVGDHHLYRPTYERTELAYVGDDNILSPLYVFPSPIRIDGREYYSALEYSYTNLFALIQATTTHVPLIPIDMMVEFRTLEQERLNRIVKRLLPKAIRQRFETINIRRLLLTAYTLGDVDYEITYSENYLPNQLIATITTGVHSSIANKIVAQNERCANDINCAYSGKLIRPYILLSFPSLTEFKHKWVMSKMGRILDVFSGVATPLLKHVADGPFLLNAFMDTMYTSCSFIRFSESVVDTVPVTILRELRSSLSRKASYATLEQAIAHEHNLFSYIVWSYGAYLLEWLATDYPNQSPQAVLDRIQQSIPVFNQVERRQAMAQCIKQLMDFYGRIQYRATQDEVRKAVMIVFGVEDEEDYYGSDLDVELQSRIQFYMPIRNRSAGEVNTLLNLVGVPSNIPSQRVRGTPSPDQLNVLLEMVDPSELNKPARRLRRRGRH